ncbi:hypothetical protein HG536_0H04760 [Torulaspora globosa]|uniref:Karyogamy protein n=1 Tax=Torulaspora globosa TaxID=48254 RepID=A0A7G3ZNL4_9SACH|nr:uncharacterized protein HG536_0H04760 [Torulaspora globosa]QLL35100.1 hypothetical protein HG536_0H04760 [Torulaspora globosa]
MIEHDESRNFLLKITGHVAGIQDILKSIEESSDWNDSFSDLILDLWNQLRGLKGHLASIFTLDVPLDRISDQLLRLQNNKGDFASIVGTVSRIEPSLSHLLDILESERSKCKESQDFGSVLNLIENCMQIASEADVWLGSSKSVLDASLEYNEILKDHIETLENVIETNIELCFELQEERFSSPVRHTPSFTLKQLIRLLSSNSEGSGVKLPTFSAVEEALCKKFLALKHSIPPIERSLTEILPERIQDFGRRNVPNIAHITLLLEDKKKGLLSKYRFMVDEIRELQTELIDKRWSVLFRNLNHELASILNEIEVLQSKISQHDHSSVINGRLREQLEKKTKTVMKTFNVAYKALEFSLLEPQVASETNALAQRWLDIRPQSDKILTKVTREQDDVQSLSDRLQDLSLRSNIPPAQSNPSQRSNFGAFLLKKMNIRPVIVKGTPASAAKANPVYQHSPLKEKSGPMDGLILKTAPLLPYSRQRSSSEDLFDTLEGSSGLTSDSLESLEFEKISYYSRQQSRIPILPATTLPITAIRSQSVKSSQQWTPCPLRRRSLKQPTPRALLLSAGMM